MKKFLLLVAFLSLFVAETYANKTDSLMEKWSVGIATGFHSNMMRFTGFPKELYTGRDGRTTGLFVLSAEYSAPKNFSIRPEIAFLGRGGSLHLASYNGVERGLYNLKANYFDIRVPIIYNFHLNKTKIQPYAYLAPVAGFAIGGKVSLQEQLTDGTQNNYSLKLNKGNVAAAYFAMAIGGGVKYPINICGVACHVGLDLSYQLGITDTYSKLEKADMTTNINHINGPTISTRKHSGFEMKVGFSAPIALFKKAAKKSDANKSPKSSYTPAPAVKNTEKPCYTLEEIQKMVAEGKDVSGKTICAVDNIHFDTNKSTIKESSSKYLNQVAEVLIETGLHVEIQGHTDNVGSDEYNLKLSEARALSVLNFLANCGISRDKMTYTYHGESKPLSTNDTEEGRRLNRRVAFVLIKK